MLSVDLHFEHHPWKPRNFLRKKKTAEKGQIDDACTFMQYRLHRFKIHSNEKETYDACTRMQKEGKKEDANQLDWQRQPEKNRKEKKQDNRTGGCRASIDIQ